MWSYASIIRRIPMGGMCTIGCNMTELCECRHKKTPRDDDFKRDLERRINRAVGQLNGVKAMIEDNRYCGDVLIQLSAAENAVHKVGELVFKNHMETCVIEQVKQGNEEIVEEALSLMKRLYR